MRINTFNTIRNDNKIDNFKEFIRITTLFTINAINNSLREEIALFMV